MIPRPLDGYRVLDLSSWLPGPYCSMILADLGAEVVKIERRLMGDPQRHADPFVGEHSVHFLMLNRNKKSLAMNLRREEGHAIFRDLVATADVVLESFKPGQADALGVGYSQVREMNPQIVYCSLSGYGQNGPFRKRSGHDLNYAALGGLLSIDGSEALPALPRIQIADLSGALFAAVGILAALVQRSGSKQGAYIDVGMLDALMAFITPAMAAALCGQHEREGYKYLTGDLACYNLYPTADGRAMALGALEPTFWSEFCTAIGREDLITHHIPADDVERLATISDLRHVFAQQTQAEWIAFFADVDVCCEPVQSLTEALAHAQVEHRGTVFYIEHPQAGRVGQIASPIQLATMPTAHRPVEPVSDGRTAPTDTSAPPLLGEHTAEILAELGYTTVAIKHLRETKIVATPDDTPVDRFTRRWK
jgi:alpha-methylacyl-CoA racemase